MRRAAEYDFPYSLALIIAFYKDWKQKGNSLICSKLSPKAKKGNEG